MKKHWILWSLTGAFVLLLLISDVFLWQEFSLLRQEVEEKTEINRTLRWQAELAIQQSQSLYSSYGWMEACTESCADLDDSCMSDCWQDSEHRIADLVVTLEDLPPAGKAMRDSRVGVWIAVHCVVLVLWGGVAISYLRLSARYEGLTFAYQNLLEAKRRDERHIRQLRDRTEDLLEAKRQDENRINELEEAKRQDESRINELEEAKRRDRKRIKELEEYLEDLLEGRLR